MNRDQTINQQARQLWQNYLSGGTASQADNEEFWREYEEIRVAALKNQKVSVTKKVTTTSQKKSIVGATLILEPKDRRKYKNRLKKRVLMLYFISLFITTTALWLMWLISLLFLDIEIYTWVFVAPLAVLFLLAAIPFYWVTRSNAYRYLSVENDWLLTGGSGLENRKIYLNSINKIEVSSGKMTIFYGKLKSRKQYVEISCLMSRFDELKAYLENVVRNNGYKL